MIKQGIQEADQYFEAKDSLFYVPARISSRVAKLDIVFLGSSCLYVYRCMIFIHPL